MPEQPPITYTIRQVREILSIYEQMRQGVNPAAVYEAERTLTRMRAYPEIFKGVPEVFEDGIGRFERRIADVREHQGFLDRVRNAYKSATTTPVDQIGQLGE